MGSDEAHSEAASALPEGSFRGEALPRLPPLVYYPPHLVAQRREPSGNSSVSILKGWRHNSLPLSFSSQLAQPIKRAQADWSVGLPVSLPVPPEAIPEGTLAYHTPFRNAIKASNPKITHARAAEEGPLHREGCKAISKTHNVGKHASKIELTDRVCPVTSEVVGPPRKRATRWAKAARTWKRAKALTDSSDSGSDAEEVSNESDEVDSSEWEGSSPGHSPPRNS
ncbi:Hypothetical predicted protein [Pelobates cultripes]|uniref:Uncharacterized protein n=1 Tax=Pelobates cultripes TaxID=61616 RepID=A0AAD1VND7_PELCU|nr:Hypothetical predicted protein [Pelobates cultripes]